MSNVTDFNLYLSTDSRLRDNGTLSSPSPWTENVTHGVTGNVTVTMNATDPPAYDGISTAEKVVEALLLSVIAIVAFSGNVLLWCVIIRNKTLRTNSNALVLCLSSADILVSVVNMPFTILTILKGGRFYTNELCVALGFANMTFFIASVMSLAAISLNRYVLIVHPKRFKNIYTIKNTGFCILAVWLLSLALATPPLIGWARYDYLPGQSFCFCFWEDSISYTFFMVIVCFGGPCSVMSFCYYNILREVRRSRKRLAKSVPGASSDASSVASVQSALSTTSNNNSSVRSGRQPNGNSVSSRVGAINQGFEAGDGDTQETSKKGRITSLQQVFNRQLSRKRTRVEPSRPETQLPGIAPGGTRPKSLPTRITSIKIKDEQSSPPRNTSPSRTGSKYVPQNQSAVTCKPPAIRIQAFNRSMSLDSRRSSGSTPTEAEERVKKPGRISPQIQAKIARQISTLTVPGGPKAAVGIRRKRAKTQSEMRRKQEELKLTKSFLVVILVFIICWFPFCITMFWSVFSPWPVFRPADMASLLLGFFNSCCNPVIYGVMNHRYRAGFKHILCCHWTPWHRRSADGKLDLGFGSVTGTAPAFVLHDDVSSVA